MIGAFPSNEVLWKYHAMNICGDRNFYGGVLWVTGSEKNQKCQRGREKQGFLGGVF